MITYAPGVVCFTITGYEFHYKDDSQKIPSFVKLSSDMQYLEVKTENRTFVGTHELTMSVVMSNDERI